MTDYRLAQAKDMIKCAEFTGNQPEDYLWPVVMAERDGELIGVRVTQNREDLVVAGPLRVSLGNPSFVALRLIETYDTILNEKGIKAYYFSVDSQDTRWNQAILKTGVEYKGEVNGYEWYVRQL